MDKAIIRTKPFILTSNTTNFDASTDDTAQISGPREYRIQDFWGDEPAVLEHCEPLESQPVSTQQVHPVPETRPSLVQRLRFWLDNPLFMVPINSSEHLSGKTSSRHVS